MIAIFRVAFWTVTIVEFLLFIATIIVLAVNRSNIIELCAANSTDPSVTYDTCSTGYRNFMIGLSVVVVIVNFFQVKQATPIV